MISPEIATVAPRILEGGRGPSHDEQHPGQEREREDGGAAWCGGIRDARETHPALKQ
jgi:hypothetical protein